MKYRNGFFQLLSKGNATYMKIYPPMDNGELISFEEVSKYLSSKRIMDYDLQALAKALKTVGEPCIIKLIDSITLPEDENMIINISSDRKKAEARFYPPSNAGKFLTKEEIMSDIALAGVKAGIIEENIDSFLKARKYCTDIVIAKQKEPREGKSAKITYNFNIDTAAKPRANEDGSVDFHQLDIINHVSKGDVIAELDPVDYGDPGIDVIGNAIKPRAVANATLKFASNIHLSEDGLKMYSDVDGHVSLVTDKVFVSNTYEVAADVDNSTGDIDYDGNVLIKGNVINGFTVRAKGDIEVKGVVEGAHLISDGQIILQRGIQGMNKGILEAKGNVITKFIENATIKAGGYVTTDAILHSKVSATGDITVSGRRGFVTGGELHSGTMITVKTAGSPMGTATLLEVGMDPVIVEEFRKLEKDMGEMQKELEKLVQILTLFRKRVGLGEKLSPDKMEYLKTASKNHEDVQEKLQLAATRYNELSENMQQNENGRVKIEGVAYQGVHIVISNANYFVRQEEHYCQFVKDKADIKSIGM